MAASIILGPVIGKVTSNSVRVLIETDNNARVTTIFQPIPQQQQGQQQGELKADVVRVSRDFLAFQAAVFVVDGLVPNVKYHISFQGVNNADDRQGSIRTFNPVATEFRAYAAACDRPGNGKGGLWKKMWEQYVEPGRVDLFIRHGDQVYADEAFNLGIHLLKQDKLSFADIEAKVIQQYKIIYRDTWNQTHTRKCLANCSSLMLWDDHEIRNDWGTFSQDKVPNSNDWKIAKIGRRVYWEYQRQLWDDIDLNAETDGLEGHMHVWGEKFGVVFVDTRGPRSFGYSEDNDGKYIGVKQFDRIKEALSKDGALSKVKTLIMVHSMPAFYMSTGVSRCLSCLPCMVDKMGFGLNPREQDRYITMLHDWKKAGDRDVVIVAGDLHYGIRTEIYDNKREVVLRQIITTAINNKPPPAIMTCLLRSCCMWDCCDATGAEFTFRHTEKVYEFNVGEMLLKADGNSKARIEEKLITLSRS